MDENKPKRIDAVFRNGTLTAFGITVSFSLNFFAQWASSAGDWHPFDIVPVMLLFAGTALQMWAIWHLLPFSGLDYDVYVSSIRKYMTGIVLSGLGTFGAVLVDLLPVLGRATFAR